MRSLPLRPGARFITAASATGAPAAGPFVAALAAAIALGAPPRAARAQGSLSGQGFGYPPGEISTRALGAGGGLAEFDPNSPINPASLTAGGRTAFTFQYDPEFRTTQVGGATSHNTIARFPVVALSVPFRQRFTLGLSASTLLDRSFTTQYHTTTIVGDTSSVGSTETIESRGSISDLRLGVGAYVTRWLQVGAAVHRLTGQNRLVSGRQFGDSTQFGSVSDSTTIDYVGSALSAGVVVTPVRGVSVAGSVRRGGGIRTERNDSVLTRADAPNRVGVGLRVDRIPGATIAASYAHTNWTSMRSLGTATLDPRDANELMGGVEAVGPSVGAAPLILRVGARRRTLPFAISGARVRETGVTGGLGLPLAGGRALADLAVQRSSRTPQGGAAAVQSARERAWTLSLGLTLRP